MPEPDAPAEDTYRGTAQVISNYRDTQNERQPGKHIEEATLHDHIVSMARAERFLLNDGLRASLPE